jgi:hypothetical protein
MVVRTDPGRARWAGRLRLAVLALVGLLSAHTAIYAAEFGVGDRFAQAMANGGHDGWWLPASVVILGVGLVLLIQTLGGLAHLEVRWRASGRRTGEAGRAHPAPEIRSVWGPLLPLVTTLFVVQENVEYLVAHGHLLGLDPLIVDSGIALPMLALISLGLAVLGALLRWRVAVLRARTASPIHRARRTVLSQVVAGRWRMVGALAPRQWMTDRLDAGRAPPQLLRP